MYEMAFLTGSIALCISGWLVSASPTATIPARGDSNTRVVVRNPNNEGSISEILSGIAGGFLTGVSVFDDILQDIVATVPTNSPGDIDELFTLIEDIFSPLPTSLYESVEELVANSLSPGNLDDVFETYSVGINSEDNINPIAPSRTIYPSQVGTGTIRNDAPYSLSEEELRKVIYIPEGFTYGEKPPVILVPGTGSKGGLTFGSNYIPLLTDVEYADPVWLNIPGFLFMDAQVNSEYIAYAINYISAISTATSKNQTVSLIGWSQGNLDIQWAMKYWPSTIAYVNKHIAISPDYHGTILADVICPGFPKLPCAPAVIQQEYNSSFVNQLRANGGDSAYVPTTNVFSVTDEIVQPQALPDASAVLNDARSVGVTNNELQSICNGEPAGLLYTHEGVLYNPIGFALAKDTLINEGPGQTSRIDLQGLCQEVVTSGLSLTDVIATEGTISVAAAALLLYPDKLFREPALKSYATY